MGVDAPAEADLDTSADAFNFQLTDMPDSTENLKLVIMASAPQSNGVTKAFSKAVQIGTHVILSMLQSTSRQSTNLFTESPTPQHLRYL